MIASSFLSFINTLEKETMKNKKKKRRNEQQGNDRVSVWTEQFLFYVINVRQCCEITYLLAKVHNFHVYNNVRRPVFDNRTCERKASRQFKRYNDYTQLLLKLLLFFYAYLNCRGSGITGFVQFFRIRIILKKKTIIHNNSIPFSISSKAKINYLPSYELHYLVIVIYFSSYLFNTFLNN